jgi:hypothetical protein
MFDGHHTVLPPGFLPETAIHPISVARSDVGEAGDLPHAPSVPRGSTGRRTLRNWYVAAAALARIWRRPNREPFSRLLRS